MLFFALGHCSFTIMNFISHALRIDIFHNQKFMLLDNLGCINLIVLMSSELPVSGDGGIACIKLQKFKFHSCQHLAQLYQIALTAHFGLSLAWSWTAIPSDTPCRLLDSHSQRDIRLCLHTIFQVSQGK